MNHGMGVLSAMNSINIIETVFRILAYIAITSVSIKGIQALNLYISKNLR